MASIKVQCEGMSTVHGFGADKNNNKDKKKQMTAVQMTSLAALASEKYLLLLP